MKFWKILKEVGKIAVRMIINNQKGIKGTENEKKVDEIVNSI